jgi:hypothetical protein
LSGLPAHQNFLLGRFAGVITILIRDQEFREICGFLAHHQNFYEKQMKIVEIFGKKIQ